MQVATLEPVFAELVYGSKSVKEKNVLMAYWNVLPIYRLPDGYLLDAVENEAKLWTLL